MIALRRLTVAALAATFVLIGVGLVFRPIAWLCVGPVSHLEETPDLERVGWRQRLPLSEVLRYERWDDRRD